MNISSAETWTLRSLLAVCLTVCVSLPSDASQPSVQAVPGRPFGFGIVRTRIDSADETPLETNGILLSEANDRVHYAVVSLPRPTRPLAILRRDRNGASRDVSVMFLFRGDGPLELTLNTSQPARFTVTPAPTRLAEASRLWSHWWNEYVVAAQGQIENGDYPPLLETYLPAMLSRRLSLPLPPPPAEPAETDLQTIAELITGSERLRINALRDILREPHAAWPPANLPLPRPINWSPPSALSVQANVEIEPIARHVPENCFYVRFGTFANFMWLDKLTREHGGDLARMVRLRGQQLNVSRRIQQQFGLEHSELAALLAEQFVADISLIGRDAYLADGAAVGVVIQAKNGFFSFGINQQRTAAALREKENGGKVEPINIAGKEATYLSTPDGRLRSYYVADGDFHFITTSRSMAEGFVDAGKGVRSLADNWEFRHARTFVPANRGDTLFAFMSPAFFRELLEPSCQIEVLRRRRSVAEIELAQLALLAANKERVESRSLVGLSQAGLLPPGFGDRSSHPRRASDDASIPSGGSQLILHNGRVHDSQRGARGYFLPVPDVTVDAVTRYELDQFARRANFFQERWREMDPVALGIRRFSLEDANRERLIVDAIVSPLVEKKYGRILSMIGEPVAEQVRPLPDDLIWVQAAVDGSHFDSRIGPHHLFLGVRDLSPLADLPANGLLQKLRLIATTPAYLGAWPQPGLLDRLPFGLGGKPDVNGYSQLLLGVWRRQTDGFSVLSFDPRILTDVTPHLRAERTDNPAQFRIHIGDLNRTKLAQKMNSEMFQRALNASLGNAKFLNGLSQQLGVPRSDALAEAERLLNVQLVCPLGGEYQLQGGNLGQLNLGQWTSSKWPNWNTQHMPVDYQAPLLSWFRGLEGEITRYGDRIVARVQLDMERHPTELKRQLPLFNLFGGAENTVSPKSASAKDGETSKDGSNEKRRIREF